MRRILFLSPAAEIGGAEKCLLDLVGALPRDRFECHVLLPRSGPLEAAAREAGARVSVIRWPWPLLKLGRRSPLISVALLPLAAILATVVVLRASRYVAAHRIDLLHTNGTKAHFIGAAVGLLTRVPLVWHLRDAWGPRPVIAALRFAGAIFPQRMISNSETMTAAMSDSRARHRVVQIYDGVDLHEFVARPPDPELRASLGIGTRDFVVGTVGVLAPWKGQVHILTAMPAILREVPAARLLIVGDAKYDTMGHRDGRRDLEQRATVLGLGDRALFVGWRSDVSALYRIMDVVVLASVQPESFGRVLVEAMACERAVISTDLGAPSEIIKRTGCGVLVPPADPTALAEAILALHRDPRERDRVGRLGRVRVAESFTVERNAVAISALYDEILRDRH